VSWNKAPVWDLRRDFCYYQTVAGLLMWGALSDERTDLSFTVASCPRQCSHFRVRVSESWDSYHILLSQTRDFPFRRLLQLAGLRWRYSNPPPHGLRFNSWLQTVPVITCRHGPHRKRRSSGAVQLLLIRIWCLAAGVPFV
jgi:hypothetical protein